MTKFITLKLITEEVNPLPLADVRDEHPDVEGEDDGVETTPFERHAQSASATMGRQGERIDWKPNTINVDAVRNFYPRRGGRFGCRVLMKTGVAYVVLDTHDEILEMIRTA